MERMSPLATAFFASVLLYSLQSLAFGYLYVRNRERPVALWMCGSICLLVFAFSALLTELAGGMPRDEVASLLFLLLATICVTDGALRFVGRRLPWFGWGVGAACAAWGAITALAGVDFMVSALPAGLFVPVLLWIGGVRILRSDYRHLIGAQTAGVAMIAWGAHFADYPLLREVEWFAPIGFVIATVLDVVAVVGLLVLHFEVASERAAELELEREQGRKLEALGRVAGGIAHDFNNLLTAIECSTRLLSRSRNLSDAEHGMLANATHASERAAKLTEQLLEFSRGRPRSSSVLDIAEATREMAGLMRSMLGDGVRLHIEAPPGPLLVVMDPAQWSRVMLNFVVNARDAMPGQGDVSISLAEVASGELGLQPANGRFVQIEVSDTGQGIAPEVIDKVFDPFFSTKELGRGTGLGLAIVHGIVGLAGGKVTLESTPGRGTIACVLLPMAVPGP